jgi:hypothetical protein
MQLAYVPLRISVCVRATGFTCASGGALLGFFITTLAIGFTDTAKTLTNGREIL